MIFFRISFLHRFLPLPSALIFLYCNVRPYLGEGKEAVWTERGISSHACSSTPPRVAGRGREEWHGYEWENILAFSMGLLVRSFDKTGSDREDTRQPNEKWNKGQRIWHSKCGKSKKNKKERENIRQDMHAMTSLNKVSCTDVMIWLLLP